MIRYAIFVFNFTQMYNDFKRVQMKNNHCKNVSL